MVYYKFLPNMVYYFWDKLAHHSDSQTTRYDFLNPMNKQNDVFTDRTEYFILPISVKLSQYT